MLLTVAANQPAVIHEGRLLSSDINLEAARLCYMCKYFVSCHRSIFMLLEVLPDCLSLPITVVHIFLLLVTIGGSLSSSRCWRCFSFPPKDIHTQPGFTSHPPLLPAFIHLSSALVSTDAMCKLSCFNVSCPSQAYSFRWGGEHGGVPLMKEERKAGSVEFSVCCGEIVPSFSVWLPAWLAWFNCFNSSWT